MDILQQLYDTVLARKGRSKGGGLLHVLPV